MIDQEKMQKFYEFGGLLVYEVQEFDNFSFSNVVYIRTFSSDKATASSNYLNKLGRMNRVVSYFVNFDGMCEKSD